ncbi:MAG: fatty acid oxidation complex subunit alpha FadJ [Polyangiales bacterium]
MTAALTTTASKSLMLAVRSDGIAVLTYDTPNESVNALQPTSSQELEEILDRVERDSTIRAVVLVSGKPDSFVVGADVEMLKSCRTAADAEALSRAGQESFRRLSRSDKPFVAAVHGAAVGGGFELALACHARVCTDDPKTSSFGLPEIQLGLIPGANGLPRLADHVGLQVALDHGLTGKTIRARKARSLGLVDEVVPKAHLLRAAIAVATRMIDARVPGVIARLRRLVTPIDRERARRLALEQNPIGRKVLFRKARALTLEKTGGHFPAALKVIDVLEAYAARGFDAAADVEARAFGELVVSPTARQLMGIFFATQALKRDPGVADPKARARSVQKIGVLGAGLMGAGIAYASIDARYEVRLKDRDAAAVGRGRAYVDALLSKRVRAGRLSKLDRAAVDARLSTTTTYDGIGRCELVIEAVFEDLAIKRAVLAEIEDKCAATTVFASNTSSIPIGHIADGCRRPQNVVGMHYFSPVEKMPLLEVIRHRGSSDEAVATAVSVGKRQGKTVIVVNDGVGFYTSRALAPFMNEAAHLLSEGVAIEAIDAALVAWGFPVGPMTLLDEVGIDVAAHVAEIVHAAFGARMTPPALLPRLVKDNRKGRKNQRGLYLYDERGNKRRDPNGTRAERQGVDASVYAVLGVSPTTKVAPLIAPEEIQARCVLALVNEAMRCLGEGVLRSPRDGDVGAVFGLGFPPFRGGPFRWVDSVGSIEVLRRIEALRTRVGDRFEPAPTLVNLAKIDGRFYRD